MEETVSERIKSFTPAHRDDEDRQAYISASRHASSVINKVKAEAWQATCSSLSLQSNPKPVYSLSFVLSLALLVFNFSNCSSTTKLASIFADYLRSHFSVSFPKVSCCRARGYPSELRRATCPEESHSSSIPHYPPLNFLQLPQTSLYPLPLAQTNKQRAIL